MKNLIVTISIKLNDLTDDAITVGLLAFNEQVAFYDFSYEKLKSAKPLLDNNSMYYLENALIEMGKAFQIEGVKNELDFKGELLNEKYISYLSKYSNGILKISEPKGLATLLDKHTFGKLFRSFVGTNPVKNTVNVSNSLRRGMINILKHEVFERIDTLYPIDPTIINGIYARHRLDFIGVNGSPFAGLAVDFNKEEGEVGKTILTFRNIAKGLAEKANKNGMSSGRYEVYFNEPESMENKRLLDIVMKDKSKGFEMIGFDKIDSVIKRLEGGGFKKFSSSKLALI
ncbi:hypothetical protein MM213_13225 [Belliella sp. R4-6]|uniref:DUF3037 domain-containing protein n=1 Tax=Belliella alkalica TaxID=1730871 RepID=A0ABS9VDE1_9BACT|nr:hypothetical protein [Belliella alkalica]MCH7414454.1 hypothetical protein [Belliella alkalica]